MVYLLKMGGSFYGYVSHNQMVYIQMVYTSNGYIYIIYIYILNIVIFHSYVGLPEGKNTNHIILVGGLEHVFYFPQ